MAVINLSYFEAYAKTMFLILNHFQSVDIPPPSWLLLVLIKCTLNAFAFAFAFTAAFVWVWASIFFPLCVPGRVGLVAPGAIWYMAMGELYQNIDISTGRFECKPHLNVNFASADAKQMIHISRFVFFVLGLAHY